MPGTRTSARLADHSSPPSTQTPTNSGTKRKADGSPSSAKANKERKTGEKEQKTIEESMNTVDHDEQKDNSAPNKNMKNDTATDGHEACEASHPGHRGGPSCWFWSDNETYSTKDGHSNKTIEAGESWKGENKEGESKDDPEKALKDSRGGPGLNALDVDKPMKDDAPHDEFHDPSNNDADTPMSDGAVKITKARAEAMPSNILEKGIIYFFTRGRVGIDDPENVADLQRSYFVLRPVAPGAKLTDGAIEDVKNNRLFALPKKVWPKSPRDRFMAFVEKAKTSMDDLKENFFQGSEYETKTVGTRHTPPVTPVAEGVYALTKAGDRDETHLSYMITIPREPGEMQEDIGIKSKGSFVVSLKNPTVKGPSYASLPQGPDFPQDLIDEFRGRGWMPAEPKHLDYPNAQILLIGESFNSSHALDATSKDKKNGKKETPAEELEKLEEEDELRVEHLKGDDTIFEDLHISSKDYPSVPTTW